MIQRLLATNSALCRAAALVAVLAVFGAQILEAQHSHAATDNTAECLLCQSAADLALVMQPAQALAQQTVNTIYSHHTATHLARNVLLPPARAPPYNT